MTNQIITLDIIDDIARLARLGLSDSQRSQLVTTLRDVLSHFTNIQDINTKDVPASDDATGLTNITRPDLPQAARLASVKQLMDRVPETKDDHIKVKAVFSS